MHPGMKLFLWHVDSTFDDTKTVLAEVVTHPKDKSVLGLRNCSARNWDVLLPDNTHRPLEKGNVVPVTNGFKIDFIGNGQFQATLTI